MLSPWVGKNVGRIDPRRLSTVAFLGFALVLWMRSRFNVQADFMTVLIPTIVQGAAMAFFFIPLQAIIFSGLTPDRMPAAAGLSNFVRITAGAIGTSIFTTVWENWAILHHAEITESLSQQHAATPRWPARRGRHDAAQSLATINRMVDQQAYTMAANDLFLPSARRPAARRLGDPPAKRRGRRRWRALSAHARLQRTRRAA
jgi:DHA2 family multidrug resistance protein